MGYPPHPGGDRPPGVQIAAVASAVRSGPLVRTNHRSRTATAGTNSSRPKTTTPSIQGVTGLIMTADAQCPNGDDTAGCCGPLAHVGRARLGLPGVSKLVAVSGEVGDEGSHVQLAVEHVGHPISPPGPARRARVRSGPAGSPARTAAGCIGWRAGPDGAGRMGTTSPAASWWPQRRLRRRRRPPNRHGPHGVADRDSGDGAGEGHEQPGVEGGWVAEHAPHKGQHPAAQCGRGRLGAPRPRWTRRRRRWSPRAAAPASSRRSRCAARPRDRGVLRGRAGDPPPR